MAQLFPPYANTLARVGVALPFLGVGVLGWALQTGYWASYTTGEDVPVSQPVPFSHQHHVAGLGIDCRYCHTGVETSAHAGIPPTETCMTCHSQVWRDAPLLAPVRESWVTGRPLIWNRVNDLPDHVYFNHSIHVRKGIGCVSCHGRVDEMPLMAKANSLYMRWCLDCHRNPGPHIRPPEAVFAMTQPGPNSASECARLVSAKGIHPERLADCSMCHR